jgi:CO/xanthine dehydrogenase FAD-binding subunit
MRGDPEAHHLVAPSSLDGVLSLLAREPGEWTPIAGGTELMVAYAAGRLNSKKLVNLWGLRDLRFVASCSESISIGAGSTFRDLRADSTLSKEFPLLAKAASWIGSIANQSRATLGGNLVNGSPAADSSPALLVYDAEVELISLRGKRRLPYSEFHTGYKRNVLAADELLYSVHLPKRFSQHRQYLRKVGTRRAMAISKTALSACEEAICSQAIGPETMRAARAAVLAEVAPIDDIRSTAEYRRAVTANLLQEFLTTLLSGSENR